MKKLFTVIALATVIATPAFAQSFDPEAGTGNVAPYTYSPPAADSGLSAYAQIPAPIHRRAAQSSRQLYMYAPGGAGSVAAPVTRHNSGPDFGIDSQR